MANSLISSTAVTMADTAPPNAKGPGPMIASGRVQQSVGTVECLAADGTGSIYRMARIPSNARISSIDFSNDALAGGTVNIGLYDTLANGSGAVSASLFAAGVAVTAAATNVNGYTAVDIAKVEQQVWQLLGLTKDPGKLYDVGIAPATAITNAGTLTLRVNFVQGN
jgi:hypothetical protein